MCLHRTKLASLLIDRTRLSDVCRRSSQDPAPPLLFSALFSPWGLPWQDPLRTIVSLGSVGAATGAGGHSKGRKMQNVTGLTTAHGSGPTRNSFCAGSLLFFFSSAFPCVHLRFFFLFLLCTSKFRDDFFRWWKKASRPWPPRGYNPLVTSNCNTSVCKHTHKVYKSK